MRVQLIAKIRDQDLLQKSIHELGTLFYLTDKQDNIIQVLYYSGSRIVLYVGSLDENLAQIVHAAGHKVDIIEVDEIQGYVRILQS